MNSYAAGKKGSYTGRAWRKLDAHFELGEFGVHSTMTEQPTRQLTASLQAVLLECDMLLPEFIIQNIAISLMARVADLNSYPEKAGGVPPLDRHQIQIFVAGQEAPPDPALKLEAQWGFFLVQKGGYPVNSSQSLLDLYLYQE